MIKHLVAFGCGWTLGQELDDPALQAYPSQIAAHFGWTVDNKSTPNTKLVDMALDLRNWLANSNAIEETLILIGLTDETRGGTDAESTFDNMVQAYELAAAEYGANLIQFKVLTRNYKLKVPTLIESSSALEMLVIRDKPRKAPLFNEHKFPNEQGHKIISEFLIKQIDSAILAE